jgi:hypothetical protein
LAGFYFAETGSRKRGDEGLRVKVIWLRGKNPKVAVPFIRTTDKEKG